jgi:dimethylargininase
MLTVLTREVSPTISNCLLTFMDRQSIDYEQACEQHRNYRGLLQKLGLNVISLPVLSDLPDAVFIEDTAVVLDEVAIVCLPAPESRRLELASVIEVLRQYRPLRFLTPPATLEGGDIVVKGSTVFVGNSSRTNLDGISQLHQIIGPLGYDVRPVKVSGCLHLSTGASWLGRDAILVNPEWVDVTGFRGCEIIPVPESEPWAANVVKIGHWLVLPATFTATRELLEERGFSTISVDVSEFLKAEGGVTCMRLMFRTIA